MVAPGESLIFERQAPTIPLRRVTLVALMATGAVVGLLPLGIFLPAYRVAITAVALVAAVAVSAWRLRRFTSVATERPAFGEFLLGGWSTVAHTVGLSFLGIVSFWTTWGALRVAEAVVGWLGWTFRPDHEVWAGRASHRRRARCPGDLHLGD